MEMDVLSAISRFVLLAGLAFLGFYVFGLIMGVFAPGQIIAFSIIALVVVVTFAVHVIRMRRPMDAQQRREMRRELNSQKERRGF
jgi:hypothetical protein